MSRTPDEGAARAAPTAKPLAVAVDDKYADKDSDHALFFAVGVNNTGWMEAWEKAASVDAT